ncbi:MAG: type II toxin-antitoxin system VapC family toxin [Cyclobacteriaceae bacterium]|nr:type II toxin-antitoxin system VapC family toxin [Cyclobacteriaceae bacterium]MBX2945155.1 type II toxin-antitoxin system VapC family toxin [Cyclobacteriaceae bacterium]UYN85820.1 MAG: type II toxin-antitoxin system VapC family toxin [Cyclobacteriaceae bacterium]
MIQRIYIDTSVIGGLFDIEFSNDTKPFFDRVEKGELRIVYSEITIDELANAPDRVKNYLQELNSTQKEFVEISQEAVNLADTYIREKVVGKTSRADCIHIALATLYKVDILVSWNFKHIVNISKIRGYNSVNLRLGHQTLEIRTPKEI